MLASSKYGYSSKRVQDALDAFFLRRKPLCSANRRVASDLQQLNTQQQFSANDASYFPPEAAGTGRSLEEGDYWTSIHQPDTYTVQNQCSQSSASAGGVNMSQFALVHRSTCRSAEQTFVVIVAVRMTFWPLDGRDSVCPVLVSKPSVVQGQKEVLTFQSIKCGYLLNFSYYFCSFPHFSQTEMFCHILSI